MAQTAKHTASNKEAKQAKAIQNLKKKENWMKWGLIAALIIILLLLLFIGYATDWTRGFKTASDTPLSTSLDSTKSGATTPTTGTSGSGGGGGNSGTPGTPGSNGSNGTNGTGGGRTTTNNSTTNNSTTTNNTTTTNPPAEAPTNLLDVLNNIYESTGIGSNLDTIVNNAIASGIDVQCENGLLIRTCTLSVGDQHVTIRGLLSTGLVTSVIRDLL